MANLIRLVTRPRFIALVIGAIFIGIYCFLGVNLFQQQQQRETLASQIAVTEQALSKRAVQQEPLAKLEERLAAAQLKLAAGYKLFYTEEDRIAILNDAVARAEESGLKVVSAETKGKRTAKIGENSYPVLGFNLKVEGDREECLAYIGKLQQHPGALVIEQVTMDKAADSYALNIELSAYGRPTATAAASSGGPAIATPQPEAEARLEELHRKLAQGVEQGGWRLLVTLVEAVRALDPSFQGLDEMLYTAYVAYGAQLSAEGRYEEAVAQFHRALALKPDGKDAQSGLEELTGSGSPAPEYIVLSKNRTSVPGTYDSFSVIWVKVVDGEGRLVPGLMLRLSSYDPPWTLVYPGKSEPSSDGSFRLLVGRGNFEVAVIADKSQVASNLHTDTPGFTGFHIWEVVFQRKAG